MHIVSELLSSWKFTDDEENEELQTLMNVYFGEVKIHKTSNQNFAYFPASDELCENVAKIIAVEASWQWGSCLLNRMQTHRIMKFHEQ